MSEEPKQRKIYCWLVDDERYKAVISGHCIKAVFLGKTPKKDDIILLRNDQAILGGRVLYKECLSPAYPKPYKLVVERSYVKTDALAQNIEVLNQHNPLREPS